MKLMKMGFAFMVGVLLGGAFWAFLLGPAVRWVLG